MFSWVLKRAGSIVVTLGVASVVIFAITQLLPGDVAQMILGQHATPESLDAIRRDLGLTKPFHTRYLDWMEGVLRGDLGTSLSVTGVKIVDLLVDRSKNSVFLAFWSSVALVPLSLLAGLVAGLKRDTWLDKTISLTSMVFISLPEFVSGVFFILVFSLWWNILPAAANIDPSASLFSQFRLLVLPILTLSLVILGYVARMTRASVIEVASSHYVRAATLKGLSDREIITGHILRNALLPSITVIAMNIGWLVGGLVVVETVFAYPGLGSLLLFAIVQRDVPLIQDTALFVVGVYMVLNFAADLLYGFLNPRIRYS